jgi:phosphate/sulfate permease
VETIYLIIVIILFLLAASDLVVGVSNDAVNFLNAAIGSKVSSFKVVMSVAAVGILIGAVFSSGMMEVARKGIMNPGEFYFSEIMIIFLAVMVTDVLLLDTFNTIGLPTSTTVSIVFELLGASVGMASIKLINSDGGLTIAQFINSSKALEIIAGILLSVGVAFTVGAIIQWLVRIVFSFNFKRRIKYYGALWGGLAFTAMTYFILIKGAKGASFMTDSMNAWITTHSLTILIYSFVGWSLLLQLFFMVFRLNILKIIVLVGTFSLAMAFAGNDLVNFIGVPIAGFNAYEFFHAGGSVNPDGMLMTSLAGKVRTPQLFLLLAGVIMVITLYTSKKARSVVQTSLDLSRQDAGDERFRSTWLSKVLVRGSINFTSGMKKVLPDRFVETLEKQFVPYKDPDLKNDPPEFDLIRASVTLTVSSILIAFGTSMKLPLSTTYVTFMVAMGTSLSDKAWDRESAVYRISGVLSVIGGWFLTAISAFTVAFIMAYIFYYGELPALIIMLLIVAYFIYRTHRHHKKSSDLVKEEVEDVKSYSDQNIADKSNKTILKNIKKISVEYFKIIQGLEKESVKDLRQVRSEISRITGKTKYLKDHINVIIEKLKADSVDNAYYFVQVLDYMREMLHSISFIVEPALKHVDNNHKPLLEIQIKELNAISKLLSDLIKMITKSMETVNYSVQEQIIEKQNELLNSIEQINKNQIRRLKATEVGTRNSILFMNILNETKNLTLQVVNLYKSQRDFENYKNGKNK